MTTIREQFPNLPTFAPLSNVAPVERSIGSREAAKRIRAALRKRTGKAWSVRCGTGTGYSWLTISAPSALRTWTRIEIGRDSWTGAPIYEQRPTSEGFGAMSDATRAALAAALGIEVVHPGGVTVAPGALSEYVQRAETGAASYTFVPDWD